MAQYYIIYQNRQVGPMDRAMLFKYGLNPNSMVWSEGMPQWAPAYTVPELMEIMPPAGTTSASDKDRIVTAILALLIGGLGIQYFYLGKVKAGVISILLSLVSCGIFQTLTFIQGIVLLFMSDEEFQRKFVASPPSAFPLF